MWDCLSWSGQLTIFLTLGDKSLCDKGTPSIGIYPILRSVLFLGTGRASFYLPCIVFLLSALLLYLVSAPGAGIFFSHKPSSFNPTESGWTWSPNFAFWLCDFRWVNWPLWASVSSLGNEVRILIVRKDRTVYVRNWHNEKWERVSCSVVQIFGTPWTIALQALLHGTL